MSREICFDTETTGLDPRDGHKVIEIGCVELIDRVKTGRTYHVYINPLRDVPEEAFKIHGLSSEFLRDKQEFREIAQEFVDFVQGAKLVAHNASFDMKFINFELRECGLEIIERVNVVDSLQLARNKFPGSPNSLDALCKRFSIDASKRIKHGALLDAELLADIYLELIGGSQYSMFEQSEKLAAQVAKDKLSQKVVRDQITHRDFPLSEEEKEGHKKYILENFKENSWGY